MIVSFNKAAAQRFMEEMQTAEKKMRQSKDYCGGKYSDCRARYVRCREKLEEQAERAHRKLEAAESQSRAASAAYNQAVSMQLAAEANGNGSTGNNAGAASLYARTQANMAAQAAKAADEEYRRIKRKQNKLEEIWSTDGLQLGNISRDAESHYSSFSRLLGNANQSMAEFIDYMDRAQEALYNESVQSGGMSGSGGCSGGAGAAGGAGGLTEEQQYVQETLSRVEQGFDATVDRDMVMAGSEVSAMRSPGENTAKGRKRGEWRGSVFHLDNNFVPGYKNPRRLNVGQIKQELKSQLGLSLEGIPYVNGCADFSSLSVANISTKDMVIAAKGMSSEKYDAMSPLEKTRTLDSVFTPERRQANFKIADEIAAKMQIPIPGLRAGYTAQELKKWRGDPAHPCSWDEQIGIGYNLVPAIIHGNLPHTGMVGSTTAAARYFRMKEAVESDPVRRREHFLKSCLREKDAPISISQLKQRGNEHTPHCGGSVRLFRAYRP